MITVLLVDPMPGVRDGLRWLLASAPDIEVCADVATVAEAQAVASDVVVTGLLLADGLGSDLVARPVVVHTWLPADERDPVATLGVAAVVQHGRLRHDLAGAIRVAASGKAGR